MSEHPTMALTAGQLAEALFSGRYGWHRAFGYVEDEPTACLSFGHYPGTTIPIRAVPKDSPMVVTDRHAGGRVEDADGGWIAARFGPGLCEREMRAVRSFFAANHAATR